MSGGFGHLPKRTKWSGNRKRCKRENCKKRIRSYPELGLCNKCVRYKEQ